MREHFYGWPYGNKVRPHWWSLVNWLKGYKFGPTRRCRRCGHTSPYHCPACASGSSADPQGGE